MQQTTIQPEDVTKLAHQWVSFAFFEDKEAEDANTWDHAHVHVVRANETTARVSQMLQTLLGYTREHTHDFIGADYARLQALVDKAAARASA